MSEQRQEPKEGWNYWTLSYRTKLKRTLLLFPFIFIILLADGPILGFPPIYAFVLALIGWAIQVTYNYWMWTRQAPEPIRNEPVQSRNSDYLGDLERLAKLRESGVLSEGEFLEEKSKLLAQQFHRR